MTTSIVENKHLIWCICIFIVLNQHQSTAQSNTFTSSSSWTVLIHSIVCKNNDLFPFSLCWISWVCCTKSWVDCFLSLLFDILGTLKMYSLAEHGLSFLDFLMVQFCYLLFDIIHIKQNPRLISATVKPAQILQRQKTKAEPSALSYTDVNEQFRDFFPLKLCPVFFSYSLELWLWDSWC